MASGYSAHRAFFAASPASTVVPAASAIGQPARRAGSAAPLQPLRLAQGLFQGRTKLSPVMLMSLAFKQLYLPFSLPSQVKLRLVSRRVR